MAQAKIATPQGKLNLSSEKYVSQETNVGNQNKVIAGALREEQTVGRPVLSKYAIIGSDPVTLFDNISNDLHPAIDLLTITQAAELLKDSVTSVSRLQQGRRIPFIKVGGSVRLVMSYIVSYLGKHRVESIDQ